MQTPSPYPEAVYTVTEVATMFRISPKTVRGLIRQGELPAMRLGRAYRIPQSIIDQYFNLPARSHLAPEDLGLGMWADDEMIGDSVEYVNRIRAAEDKTLRQVIQELATWPA